MNIEVSGLGFLTPVCLVANSACSKPDLTYVEKRKITEYAGKQTQISFCPASSLVTLPLELSLLWSSNAVVTIRDYYGKVNLKLLP